jgi:hypothetical protein
MQCPNRAKFAFRLQVTQGQAIVSCALHNNMHGTPMVQVVPGDTSAAEW